VLALRREQTYVGIFGDKVDELREGGGSDKEAQCAAVAEEEEEELVVGPSLHQRKGQLTSGRAERAKAHHTSSAEPGAVAVWAKEDRRSSR